MEVKNIRLLKEIEENRHNSDRGLLARKDQVKFWKLESKTIVTCGGYENDRLNRFVVQAILEKSKEIFDRAYELEEINYQEVKRLARIEALNFIAGEDLIKPEER